MTWAKILRSPEMLLILLSASLYAIGAETDATHRARIERLENALFAPCCYTEPLSRHQSEIAVKMRLEIQGWVNAGKTDEEILALYRARYGAKVLVPPQRKAWMLSDGVPWLLLVLSGLGLVWLLSRWRAKSASRTVAADGPALPPIPDGDEDWDTFEPLSNPSPGSPRQ